MKKKVNCTLMSVNGKGAYDKKCNWWVEVKFYGVEKR